MDLAHSNFVILIKCFLIIHYSINLPFIFDGRLTFFLHGIVKIYVSFLKLTLRFEPRPDRCMYEHAKTHL